MHWVDEAPVVSLDLVDAVDGRLVFAGPSSSTRREGGVNVVGSAVLALVGARFLRAPLPLLFPVMFVAAGAVGVVVGATKLAGRCAVEVDRTGLTLRWRLPALAERRLRISVDEIAWLAVSARAWTVDNDHGGSDVREDFVLAVHTADERVIPFECFPSREAAGIRRAQLERVLLQG
jgi:hypothetical protein